MTLKEHLNAKLTILLNVLTNSKADCNKLLTIAKEELKVMINIVNTYDD